MSENRGIRALFLATAIAVFSGFTFLDDVARRVEEGNQLFGRAEFDAALEAYRSAQTDRPDSPELHYNVGDALYKQGAVDEALAAFQKAAETGDATLGASAFYNIGNALYKKKAFDQAVAAYEKALELNPSDLDTKINLEMALEKMQEQEKEKQQDKNEGDDNEDQEQKNQDEQSDDQESKDEQQKDQQDQQNKDQENQNPDQQKPQDQQKPPDQQQQEGQQQPGELSPEEAERLLDALKDRETESQKRRRIKLQGKRYRGNPW